MLVNVPLERMPIEATCLCALCDTQIRPGDEYGALPDGMVSRHGVSVPVESIVCAPCFRRKITNTTGC